LTNKVEIDLPTRPFYPAIAGNLKQLPVAVYFKQLPETAGFLRNRRFFLPEISVFNLLYFLKKKCARSKTMRKFFLPLELMNEIKYCILG
jgi:hypothetical protein